MAEAIAELRDLITRLPKCPSSESKWFYYYSYLEDFLSHEKMPAENSIEKQVIPRVLSLSSAERMDFMKAIGANGVAADRWVDIALLDSLNGKDYQTSKDSNYRQSMMFIRACSLYVAGRSNQAYDLCCQLIKTAAPPLLDRCIRLSLLTVSGSEPTNDAKITQRRTFLKNLIETRRTAKKFLTVL